MNTNEDGWRDGWMDGCTNKMFFSKIAHLLFAQLPLRHLSMAIGSTLIPKKASVKISLVRFIILSSHVAFI